MYTTRTGWVIAGVVATGILLFSCSAGPAGSQGEPDIGPVPAPRTAAELTLPLDPFRLSLQGYTRVQRAAWLLTRDCVRRFGGNYTLTEAAVLGGVPALDGDNDRRYGVFDGTLASTRGYRVPEAAPPDRSWNPTDAELLLVRGVTGGGRPPADPTGKPLPEDGCSGEATKALETGASAPPNDRLANELGEQAHARAEADSRVRAAMALWSGCMSRSGYDYRSIWEPNDRNWPLEPGDVEIATAKADVSCKLETNLVGIWLAVESAYQTRLIEANSQALDAVKAYIDAQARNAARVVGA